MASNAVEAVISRVFAEMEISNWKSKSWFCDQNSAQHSRPPFPPESLYLGKKSGILDAQGKRI